MAVPPTAATASATAATDPTYRDLQTYAAEVSIDMDSKGESVAPAGTHFTCFTSAKVLRCTQVYLLYTFIPKASPWRTKVQRLTPEELGGVCSASP